MAKGAAAAGESARFAQWHDATLAAGPVCRARRQRRWRGVDDAGGIGAQRAEQGEADVRKMEPALYDTCLLPISHHGAEHHFCSPRSTAPSHKIEFVLKIKPQRRLIDSRNYMSIIQLKVLTVSSAFACVFVVIASLSPHAH